MTCNHVLDEEDIKIGKTIEYSLDNDKIKYSIKIDDSRILYTNNNFDFTIIQLRKKEYPDVDSLLEIDEGILKKKQIKHLNKTSIILLHYPNGKTANVSFGKIKGIDEDTYTIHHNCGSEKGSSGGPLINNINMKLIGIHKDNEPNTNFNLGIYVKPVTEYFFNDVKLKKIKDENIFNEKDNYDEEFNNLNNVEMKEMKPIQNFTFNKKMKIL